MLQQISAEPQNKYYHKSASTLPEITDHDAESITAVSAPHGVCDGKKGRVCILPFCIQGNMD